MMSSISLALRGRVASAGVGAGGSPIEFEKHFVET